MSDVKVGQKQTLSRQEAARLIAALAEGLGDDGHVTVRLGSSTVELSVADQVDGELEVAVDGDEIELELELTWSRSGRTPTDTAPDRPEEAEFEPASGEDDSEEPGPGRAAFAEEEPEDGESDEAAAGEGEAGSVQAAEQDRIPGPRRGRRSASTGAGESALNGVDTAAVRAWAAANGLTVSPRGRIKVEVLQAYRAAGN